jgi:Na+-driven multidrug efflux pump
MLVFVIGFTLGNLVSIFREPLVGLYSQEAAVVKHGMARISVISSVHFFCGMMDVMVGVLRGMGYAIVPMGLSIAGVCGFRILWIQTVFRKIGTIQSLYLSYPVTWGTTFLAQLICFMILYRRMMKRAKTREREAIAQEAV